MSLPPTDDPNYWDREMARILSRDAPSRSTPPSRCV